jgi:hypothetical protein
VYSIPEAERALSPSKGGCYIRFDKLSERAQR